MIGADIDEIEALTGKFGRDVEAGIPTFAERSNRRVQVGSTSAVISYVLLSSSTCTVKVWTTSNYIGQPVVDTNDTAAEVSGGIRSLGLLGLTPDTMYYGKRWCGDDVDVFRFRTAVDSASTERHIQLSPPAGVTHCTVEYQTGSASSVTSSSVAVSSGICKVTVPSNATSYRASYIMSGGLTLKGDFAKVR